jgi:exodeoxyribonuclease VII small subunit
MIQSHSLPPSLARKPSPAWWYEAISVSFTSGETPRAGNLIDARRAIKQRPILTDCDACRRRLGACESITLAPPKIAATPMPQSNKTHKLSLSDFESAVAELEGIVTAMESGELSLEQSLQRFERGVTLVKACQEAVRGAELRIRQLTEDGEETALPDDEPGL